MHGPCVQGRFLLGYKDSRQVTQIPHLLSSGVGIRTQVFCSSLPSPLRTSLTEMLTHISAEHQVPPSHH